MRFPPWARTVPTDTCDVDDSRSYANEHAADRRGLAGFPVRSCLQRIGGRCEPTREQLGRSPRCARRSMACPAVQLSPASVPLNTAQVVESMRLAAGAP